MTRKEEKGVCVAELEEAIEINYSEPKGNTKFQGLIFAAGEAL